MYCAAIEFKTILNNQDPNIQYTMGAEDADKTLTWVHYINLPNKLHFQRPSETSGHNPQILKCIIFTGFLHRTYAICQPTKREEVDFWSDVSLKIDTTSWRE